jgi:hypothetical protein
MAIQNTVLSTSASNVLIGSGNLGTATTTIYFCNKTVNINMVNVYAVMNGFTANTNNIIYSNVSLTAGETLVLDVEKIFLGPGDMLQANCGASNSVVATVSSIGL